MSPYKQIVSFLRVLPLLLLALISARAAESRRPEKVDFNRDIRPILASKCYACHGPDDDKREAGLRMDQRAGATKDLGGYAALAPGDPEASEVWKRIITDDQDDVMPPPSSPKKVTFEERELIRRWIAEGAEYQEHWSFLPVAEAKPPRVRQAEWVRNDIDRFVLAELEKRKLRPSPEAERHVLIRRLSLDLTGLPPTPEEVAAFVTDQDPSAYQRLVDRLLNSPHFGERWGRHWLDLARYADSDGFLGDKVRPNAFRFRDWVIQAVNDDMPFDQFTREQLAGDLLPAAAAEQQTATGFHRNAPKNTEAGVDKEDARFQMLADRVNTTGRVWLGLTVGCAQCHTHKFDPITIRDYYSIYAFFNNTDDQDVPNTNAPGLREAKERRQTYVHMAGDYSRRGPDVVPAALPAVLKMPATPGERTRLDLADWLVAPGNPLTRRVAVNQIWSKLFGTGLVSTPDDFGANGAPPSHPKLLDWLATQFLHSGWSRKEMIRLIVNSATYRQASLHRADLVEIDPLNRLLARQNRIRLEAEILRDSFLATGGILARNIGGPSIRPPLPSDVTDVGRSVKWEVSQHNEKYRRGMYILLLRSVVYPMLTTFDAPDASEACVKRDRSNTPLQALTLLNDPVFVEAAQALAARVMAESATDSPARLRRLFELCLSRPPAPAEMQRLNQFADDQRRLILAGGDEALKAGPKLPGANKNRAIEAATLMAVGRILMNLDEFINRE
ncbi:MAG TPA: PSD1 and planctomycete cytochrome C domain-containing protein [Prosthecobacter sp.]|nr:PSD1 and planctomycete cytochrome C domain-containing protein [Prosthecobacter sp.]